MMLTIHTLFNDPNIVNAVIQRVLKTRKDTIYWQQYLGFRRTTTRVFKDYIGQVTGVMAGSINSRYGEKPIRERRNNWRIWFVSALVTLPKSKHLIVTSLFHWK